MKISLELLIKISEILTKIPQRTIHRFEKIFAAVQKIWLGIDFKRKDLPLSSDSNDLENEFILNEVNLMSIISKISSFFLRVTAGP